MSSERPTMSSEEFRRAGRAVIDWIADYWDRVESLPVLAQVRPGEIAAAIPPHAPETGFAPGPDGAGWEQLLADMERIVLPGITHWQHPGFYGFFPANATGPAVLGELLSAGLGVQGMLWLTSPACTEMETRVLDWMGEAIGLPPSFRSDGTSADDAPDQRSLRGGGVIQGTASEATLVALLAARKRMRRVMKTSDRADTSRFTMYASTQAHSSVIKAALIAGLAAHPEDRTQVRLIETDDSGAMRPDALGEAVRADLAAGRIPFFVCATLGTTGTLANDPLDEIIVNLAHTPVRPWVHVDAAHAGAACICPELRAGLRGVEGAHSFCFNPHKWLLVNFDCDCFWTRDRESLIGALSVTPEYLRNSASESGAVIDYRDWQIPLGRRFRALKLWLVLRRFGLEGLRAHVRSHCRLAQELESWIRADPRFEVVTARTLNLVVFRLRAGDAASRALLEAVNRTGRAYLTHTTSPDARRAYCVRVAIGGVRTEARHVRELWQILQSCVPAPRE